MVDAMTDAMRRAEHDDQVVGEVEEHEPATPPRHAPPRPARRLGRPSGGEPNRV